MAVGQPPSRVKAGFFAQVLLPESNDEMTRGGRLAGAMRTAPRPLLLPREERLFPRGLPLASVLRR